MNVSALRTLSKLPALSLCAALGAGALVASLPVVALAQTPDCSNPRNTVEINYCLAQELKAADAKLNTVYKQARANVRSIEQGNKPYYTDYESFFVKAQVAWIALRDADCKTVRIGWGGGTGSTGGELGCHIEKTNERTAFLSANYLPQD